MKIKPDTKAITEAMQAVVSQTLNSASAKFREAVANLAQMTHARAVQMAGQRLNNTKQQYLDALSIEQLDEDIYRISLDDSAKHLEKGYDSFDMKPGLLKNAKVSKKGYRYRSIPFEHNPNSKVGNMSQVQMNSKRENRLINELAVGRTSKGNLRSDLKGMLKAIKDAGHSTDGDFTIRRDPNNSQYVIVDRGQGSNSSPRVDVGFSPDNLLDGIKQTTYQTKSGQNRKAYYTFRTVSNNPDAKGKWIHPGFNGARIFPDLSAWAEQQLQKILADL